MPWAISLELCRPGDLLTRADVYHLHDSREEAERCGVERGRAPELVKLERRSERVFEVLWSLSDAAGGRLRRSTAEDRRDEHRRGPQDRERESPQLEETSEMRPVISRAGRMTRSARVS